MSDTPEYSKTHVLKIEREHFMALNLGLKAYEIRYNDRNYQNGDYLLLREWDRVSNTYSGKEIMVRVKHILEGFEGLQKDFVILSLNEVIDRSIA